jgi:hypothetical protein
MISSRRDRFPALLDHRLRVSRFRREPRARFIERHLRGIATQLRGASAFRGRRAHPPRGPFARQRPPVSRSRLPGSAAIEMTPRPGVHAAERGDHRALRELR